MNSEERKGKNRIIIIIALLILLPVAWMILSEYFDEIERMSINWIVVVLELMLYLFMYKGKYWAKRIAAIITIIPAMMSLLAVVLMASLKPVAIVCFVSFLFFGTISYQLLRSHSIKAYFEYCNNKVKLDGKLR